TLWLSRIRLLLATLSQRLEDHRCSPTEAPGLADRTRTIRIGYDLIAELRPTLLAAGLFNLELGSLTPGSACGGSDDWGCAFFAALAGSCAAPAPIATSAAPFSMPSRSERRAMRNSRRARDMDEGNRTPGEKCLREPPCAPVKAPRPKRAGYGI